MDTFIDAYINYLPHVSFSTHGQKRALKKYVDLDDIKYSRISAKTKPESIADFIALDIETTGLRCTSKIIEVSAVKFKNFEPIDCFSTLCHCKTISPEITCITGIDNTMCQDMPHFYQILPDLQEYIGSYNLVGHNLSFDLDCMRVHGLELSLCNRKFFDTLAIARSVISGPSFHQKYDCLKHSIASYKLDTLLKFHGIIRSSSHRSLSDAIAAGFLFKELYEDFVIRAEKGIKTKL